MTQPLDEVRGQPEIVGTQLTIVLPFAESCGGEGLAVGIDEFLFFQFLSEVKAPRSTCGCSIHKGSSGIVSTL
jgi:hypothetical protein